MGGGVTLAQLSEETTLLQVIEAVDGPIRIQHYLIRPGACEHEPSCAVHDELAEIQERLVQSLDAVIMAALASDGKMET